MQGIYKITNKINNNSYIGKSNNIERRWKDHQKIAFSQENKEYNKTLYKAFRKYGIDNFTFEIIEELEDYSISGAREKYWINKFDTYRNGYNETEGGDGGSMPGHCLGESNGRARLTKADVIQIRTLYNSGIGKSECYKLFEEKISLGGFTRVWRGETWKEIMPEVYTKENLLRNEKLGKGSSSKKSRKFSEKQIKEIRRRKKQGEKQINVYKDYADIGSLSSFKDIWNYRTYKEITDD